MKGTANDERAENRPTEAGNSVEDALAHPIGESRGLQPEHTDSDRLLADARRYQANSEWRGA